MGFRHEFITKRLINCMKNSYTNNNYLVEYDLKEKRLKSFSLFYLLLCLFIDIVNTDSTDSTTNTKRSIY